MTNPNSIENIDKSFESAWEANGGPAQTLFFMQTLLNNLPKELYDILKNSDAILDFGCATGEGVELLNLHFNGTAVGCDISTVAIGKAGDKYGLYDEKGTCQNFYYCGFGDPEWEDIATWTKPTAIGSKLSIVCSNVLEHFADFPDKLLNLANHTNNMLAVIVPHNEINRIDGHEYTITEASFPDRLGDLKKEFVTVITLPKFNPYWAGEQILAVYLKSPV